MDHQRVELVQGNPFPIAVGEGKGLLVSGEHPGPEAAEQLHHGEIDLPVAAVNSRVNQARLADVVGDQVAAPQIAVQPGGRLRRPAQRFELSEQMVEVAPHPPRRRTR